LVKDMEVRIPKLEAEMSALAIRMEEADRQTKAISDLYEEFKAVAGYDQEGAARRIREIAEERVESRRDYSRKESELRFAKEGLSAGRQWLKLLQEATTKAAHAEDYLKQALLVFNLLSEVKVDLAARTVQIRVKCPDPKLAKVRELMTIVHHVGPEVDLTCQGAKRHIGGRMLFFAYANIDDSTTPAIVEEQAVIVRRIFELRASAPQPSFSEVAKVIYAEFGGFWTENFVRNLVRNRAYCGVTLRANRRQNAKTPAAMEVTYPAIVSKELWQAAQGSANLPESRRRAEGNPGKPYAGPTKVADATGCGGGRVWHHPGALRQRGKVLFTTPHLPLPG
jgi:hypothetical protein